MHRRFILGHVLPRCMLALAPLSASRALSSAPGKVELRVKKRDGTHCHVYVPVGISLMHALRDVSKMDVEGTCNGAMVCATCHVKLSAASFKKIEGPSEVEEDVLARALDVEETSRLACQVDLTPELDGLEVELPSQETDRS
ncbi:ferredoxin, 2fe-2s-like protein [Leishmania major strain Friedlin]|uniref:Ferredoxin, 2fe-2s-like protein n=1 Tax=Leishmania major TaxID=5664 RepID=Q4Q611_LEIMA|nr:ferredoxin, 2fe-2s-like protein [Leishmania major strain Friedlin]CAG9579429.1 ferredoxin_-_2fe-2s-like_protein [Leishmania major strain Friedlin]CAJ08446.1 ferredoxin, 2fe-2s-like protein [Leishmania major strain Friedlin]|eukprot:XP_001685237.1 ferredoxin, 2fe-2s-like protein [Leishmania major strain Friedlin]